MDARKELRKARDAAGFSRSGLAVLAGLNKNALFNMDDDDWNPTLLTMEAIQRVLKSSQAAGA